MSRHKWKYETPATFEQFGDIKADFARLIPFLESEGIELNGGCYSDKIDMFDTILTFNGDLDLSGFSFVFGRVGCMEGGEGIDTKKLPYDKAVKALLVIAKKHVGHSIHIETSETDAEWRDGISLCQDILGHDYDLMDITQNGKLRFRTWELAKHGV